MSKPALYIEQVGQGAPLVLLHGWGMHGGIWQTVRDGLAQQHRLYIVDLPGMGFSAAPMADNLADLAQQISQQVPANANLLGWSLGGLVAMQMALEQPLARLILVGTTPCFMDRQDWQHGVEAQVFEGFFQQVMQDFEGALQKFVALIAMGSSHTRQEMKQLLAIMLQRPHPSIQALQAGLKILMHSDLRQQLAQINVPVLWIHGERDRLCPLSAAQWSTQHLPQAQLSVMQAAGHEPFLSQPQDFVNSVNRFLL